MTLIKHFPFVSFHNVNKTCERIWLNTFWVITNISEEVLIHYEESDITEFLNNWYNHFIEMIDKNIHRPIAYYNITASY